MIEGGCFCGAVRYRVEGHLMPARACHCSQCRKEFNGASSAYAPLCEASSFFWLQGEEKLTKYVDSHGWGLAFCSVCGSTLCGILNGIVYGVTLGCVDGDPQVEIEMHLFVGSKARWDHIGGATPQYEEHPPVLGKSER
jgi:hypothetical protein